MSEILTTDNFDEKTSEGIVLIDMYANWCGPCKMVAPIIDELSNEVIDAKIYKVDVDQSPEIVSKFQIKSVPTFLVLKNGNVVNKVIGANSSKEYYLDLIANAK